MDPGMNKKEEDDGKTPQQESEKGRRDRRSQEGRKG
jgi:hypothetical protein